MDTYEEFIKPHLKPKDGYNHVIIVRYRPESYGNPDKANYYIDKSNTNKLDEIIVRMQRDDYEILSLNLENISEYRDYVIIRYK